MFTILEKKKKKIKSYQLCIGYMYSVTCATMTKIRKRKLNSLVCTLNDTCVETTYSTDSTRVLRAKVSKQFPTFVAFFDPQMHSDATYVSPFSLMPHDPRRKQKSYLQINLETSNDTSAGRPPSSFPSLKSSLTPGYRGKVSGWDGHL